MAGILVANANPDSAKKIAFVLRSAGLPVVALCGTGTKAVEYSRRRHGIVVCSGRLTDMPAVRLPELCERGTDFLFLLKPEEMQVLGETDHLRLQMPLSKADLVASAGLLVNLQEAAGLSVRRRMEAGVEDERAVVERAKGLLRERNWMTEEKAHRFLQKKSMEHGRKLLESALITLSTR